MGAFIARQPNGLLCRFSSVVDCITDYNMTEDDYIEMCAEKARKEAQNNIKHYMHQFKQVVHRVSVHNEVADVVDGKGQVLVAAVVGGSTVFQAVAPSIGWDGCLEVCFKLLAGVH